MDPISQGILGAATAHAVFGRQLPRAAALIGAAAGMAPDLDVLIPVGDDPTAAWYWHRGPTHALAFIPIGGLLCALPFLLFKSLRSRWPIVLGCSLVAFATHAPLDALTAYGTLLLWPLSDQRIALDWMPIIDPVWTLTLIIGVALAVWRKSIVPSRIVLALGLAYFAAGAFQHSRALDAVHQVARDQGHTPTHARAMPSPGSLALWRGLYEHDGQIHALGVRTGYLGGVQVKPGESRQLAVESELITNDETRRHFRRFNWFADGTAYVIDPSEPYLVGDGRYSGDPADFAPLWGMDFSNGLARRYRPVRQIDGSDLLSSMFGRNTQYQPLP